MPDRRGRLRWLASSALLLAIACVSTEFDDGQFACDPNGNPACPPGLLCARDGLCRHADIEAGIPAEGGDGGEGGRADSGRDAAADVAADGDAAPVNPCDHAMWSTALQAGTAAKSLALTPDGRLFAAGQSGQQAWLAELDPCDGGIVHASAFGVPGTTSPHLNTLTATATDLVGGGGSASDAGIFGRFGTDLTPSVLAAVPGSGLSDLDSVTVAVDGTPWLGGAENEFGTQNGWLVGQGPAPCQATPGTVVGGLVPSAGSGVIGAVQADTTTAQLSAFATGCASTGPVGPPLTIAGSMASSPGALLSSPAAFFVFGNTRLGSMDGAIYVAELDTGAAQWVTANLHPNPGALDIVLGAESDGTSIYLAATQRAGFGTGTPTVYRYDVPIMAASAPAWAANPFGASLYPLWGVAVAPAGKDGVYVAGANLQTSNGAIARCTKSGQCP